MVAAGKVVAVGKVNVVVKVVAAGKVVATGKVVLSNRFLTTVMIRYCDQPASRVVIRLVSYILSSLSV